MSQQTISGDDTGNKTVSDENGDEKREIRTENMKLTIEEKTYAGVSSFGINFTLPTEAAVTALLRFQYTRRNCTTSMARTMRNQVMHARNRGDKTVSFYESFRNSGWSTHLVKALDTSVADPERQADLDEFRELLQKV